MNREYHKWYSPRLYRDMELLVFGHSGTPVLVFPTSQGRFWEYEDRGMIGAVWDRYECGAIQAFCVDSVNEDSWYNRRAHPRDRVNRHKQYEAYLIHEVLPLIRRKNPNAGNLVVTGCSFGGYQCVNFALRHPDVAARCVSMSGAYDIHPFLDGYYDQDCYFHCPVDYIQNLNDPWFLDQYRHRMQLILGVGEWDICLGHNLQLSQLLTARQIPHYLDIWGDHAEHDWPLWYRMARKFL